jgi:hypothetical protein
MLLTTQQLASFIDKLHVSGIEIMILMAVAEERLTDRPSAGETLALSTSRGSRVASAPKEMDPFERP